MKPVDRAPLSLWRFYLVLLVLACMLGLLVWRVLCVDPIDPRELAVVVA